MVLNQNKQNISYGIGQFCSQLSMLPIADIFACLLDLNFKQSKLTRLNF